MPEQPFEPIHAEPMEMLSPQQRTKMLAEILATIALRVVKKQQEQHEHNRTL